MMNVLRYCNLDESLQGEESLVCDSALERLCKTKELDYMSHIVLRLFENTEVRVQFILTYTRRYICWIYHNRKSTQQVVAIRNNSSFYYVM